MTLGLLLPHILHDSAETAATMPPTPSKKNVRWDYSVYLLADF